MIVVRHVNIELASIIYIHCIAGNNYWRELNLVVEPKITIVTIGGFKFGSLVWDHHMYIICKKYWQILIWQLHRQTTKLDSSPDFPAIQYSQ